MFSHLHLAFLTSRAESPVDEVSGGLEAGTQVILTGILSLDTLVDDSQALVYAWTPSAFPVGRIQHVSESPQGQTCTVVRALSAKHQGSW